MLVKGSRILDAASISRIERLRPTMIWNQQQLKGLEPVQGLSDICRTERARTGPE